MQILPFGWQALNYAPPKYCRVIRANDQFLVLKRTRDKFTETLIAAKIGDKRFALFRCADSLGEKIEANTDTLIYAAELPEVLAVMGYNVRRSVDKSTH